MRIDHVLAVAPVTDLAAAFADAIHQAWGLGGPYAGGVTARVPAQAQVSAPV